MAAAATRAAATRDRTCTSSRIDPYHAPTAGAASPTRCLPPGDPIACRHYGWIRQRPRSRSVALLPAGGRCVTARRMGQHSAEVAPVTALVNPGSFRTLPVKSSHSPAACNPRLEQTTTGACPRPLFDSPYIFWHPWAGGEPHMLAAGKPGWIFPGARPRSGRPLRRRLLELQQPGQHHRPPQSGYEPDGTIRTAANCKPLPAGQRIGTSHGRIWIIGSEMNFAARRPGIRSTGAPPRSAAGRPRPTRQRRLAVPLQRPARPLAGCARRGAISSSQEGDCARLARCYRLCRDAVHRLP